MTNDDDKKILDEVLGHEFVQSLIKELGLQDDLPSVQAELIDMLGLRVMKRVTYELHKILPEEGRESLEKRMGSGDLVGFRDLLAKHIEDPDRFIFEEAQKEYESIKTRVQQLEADAS